MTIRTVNESAGRILDNLLGQRVTIYAAAYIYSGTLVAYDDDVYQLRDCVLVYDTGSHESPDWETTGAFPGDWHIARNAVESIGIWK